MVLSKLYVYTTDRIGEIIRYILTPILLPIVETNLFPDWLLRIGIRRELEMELLIAKRLTVEQKQQKTIDFIRELKTLPIAINQKEANDQHYEVPDEFYRLVLGPYLKYSSGYWPRGDKTTLAESEIYMLELYCERAEIRDGMHLIDLGCGWGSVTLFMAAKYPNCKITSISNSNSQREYILATAASRGFRNVEVFTGDICSFDLPQAEYYGKADRVISIEMFEHMKNYEKLLKKISNWVKPGGKLFVHIFASSDSVPGHFENGWMAETFFTGGTLPSRELLLYFQQEFRIENQWSINGTHYQRTLEAWLKVLDSKQAIAMPILAKAYGQHQALKWFVNWRLFFIACAEFFGKHNGQEYIVSHYLFTKR